MSARAAIVFGLESVATMVSYGGTQSWRLDARHIGTFDYVVVTRNRRRAEPGCQEPHGAAFLLGKVCGVVPSTQPHRVEEARRGEHQRYLIQISEAAIIHIPNFWRFGRWPLHIASLDDLGIDPGKYVFKPFSAYRDGPGEAGVDPVQSSPTPDELVTSSASMGVAEHVLAAKTALAAKIGVPASAIEINFRL